MVLISSDTWLTDTPNTAGAISLSTRRTPGCVRSRRQRGSMPIFHEERQLQRELQHAAGEHRPGEHQHRRVEAVGEERGADDERDVQQHRRERRHREAAPGIEDARGQRHQRDEDDVGEGDAQHRHGQLELARLGGEARAPTRRPPAARAPCRAPPSRAARGTAPSRRCRPACGSPPATRGCAPRPGSARRPAKTRPSANRRRSRLGMRKATKKASVASPAPNTRAMKKSRT